MKTSNKKFRLISFAGLLCLLTILVYSACKKSESSHNTAKPVSNSSSLSTNNGLTTDHLQSDVILSQNSSILNEFFSSDAWKNIPKNVTDNINNKYTPHFETYDNIPVQALLFNIAENDPNIVYRNLMVYVFNHKFIAVIAQSIKIEGGYTRVSISDVNNNDYMHLLVNKDDNMGQFKAVKEIQFEQFRAVDQPVVSPVQGNSKWSSNRVAAPTCMQQTTTWSSCMNCAVNECASDWSCAFGCAAEWAGCLVVFSASCAFHS